MVTTNSAIDTAVGDIQREFAKLQAEVAELRAVVDFACQLCKGAGYPDNRACSRCEGTGRGPAFLRGMLSLRRELHESQDSVRRLQKSYWQEGTTSRALGKMLACVEVITGSKTYRLKPLDSGWVDAVQAAWNDHVAAKPQATSASTSPEFQSVLAAL